MTVVLYYQDNSKGNTMLCDQYPSQTIKLERRGNKFVVFSRNCTNEGVEGVIQTTLQEFDLHEPEKALVWKQIYSDCFLLVSVANWTKEKWETVYAKTREQLCTNSPEWNAARLELGL